MNKNLIGSRLRKARERKGWTQTYVCKRLGISNSTLSGYERGYRAPDPEQMRVFAQLYEVTTDYLHGISDDPEGTIDHKEIKFSTDIIEYLEKNKDLHIGGQKLNKDQKQVLIEFMKKIIAPRIKENQENQEKDNQGS